METITDRQFEIIEAAGRILSRSGVGGLTTKNLAKEMNFSESAIYRHFKSKEEIILALLVYLAQNMEERLKEATLQGGTPLEQFIRIFKNQFQFFSVHHYFVVAVFSDGLLEESQKINNTIFQIMQIKTKYLLQVLMQGQQEGIFTQRITAEELIHLVMGAFRLQMFKWRIANFQFDIQRQGDNMLASILTLIAVK